MRRLMLIIGFMVAGVAHAADDEHVQKFYFGGGFGYNKVPEFTDTKSELQLFAGYRMGNRFGLDPSYFSLALEAGYMDTSDADRDGWWLSEFALT